MNPTTAESVLEAALGRYCEQEKVTDLGTICALLFVAHAIREAGAVPPIEQLLARSGAQIRGLHRSAVNAILLSHAVTDLPVMEVGRTNMWNVYRIRKYLEMLHDFEPIATERLKEIEQWWVDRYRAALFVPRLALQTSPKRSFEASLDNLLRQTIRLADKVVRSDRINRGDTLQLTIELLVLAAVRLTNCNADHEADTSTESATPETRLRIHAIQVDIDPNDDSFTDLNHCIGNTYDWLLVTMKRNQGKADYLISKHRMQKRCQAMSIEQFLYFILHSRSGFTRTNQYATLRAFVAEYNQLADVHRLAPGLRIHFSDACRPHLTYNSRQR